MGHTADPHDGLLIRDIATERGVLLQALHGGGGAPTMAAFADLLALR